MAVAVTYPGVYIQEIPSGLRTITGVATSITAFIGRTATGPTDRPETIFSFGDFQQRYGGLQYDYPLSYAVQDFFMNGGTQAVICRLFEKGSVNSGWVVGGTTPTAQGAQSLPVQPATSGSTPANFAPNDEFTLDGQIYTVVSFDATSKTIQVIPGLAGPANPNDPLVAIPSGFATIALQKPPAPVNWVVGVAPGAAPKTPVQANAQSLPIQAGKSGSPPTVNPQPNDEFTLGGKTYTVVMYNDNNQTILIGPPGLASAANPGDALAFAGALAAGAPAPAPSLVLQAANPGTWGNNIVATVDYRGLNIPNLAKQAAAAYAEYQLAPSDLFNLTVSCEQPDGTTIVERFTNVTVSTATAAQKTPNRLDRVLKHQSKLVVVPVDSSGNPVLPATPPSDGDTGTGTGGDDGQPLFPMTYLGNQDAQTGMFLLEKIDLFNLMCIPADTRTAPYDVDQFVLQAAAVYCTQRRAMLILDPPTNWANMAAQGALDQVDPSTLGITGEVNGTETARNAAVYFPRVIKEDPVMNGQKDTFGACGIIAGIMAATDAARGVWKAPAGLDAGIAGIHSLEVKLTDEQNGELNPLGINCLRTFPVIGPVVWGARTLRGADILSDDYKYVPVRRLTLFIEESLYRGTQWAVFEPNDETLWSSLRLAVNTFLGSLSSQGAFYGYNVTCDNTTTTQNDIDLGIVNILVQIAPVKPAEFVVIQIQQIAGQTQQS